MEPSEEKPEALDVHVEEAQPKIGRNGVILIPRPSDDPRDPLVRPYEFHLNKGPFVDDLDRTGPPARRF